MIFNYIKNLNLIYIYNFYSIYDIVLQLMVTKKMHKVLRPSPRYIVPAMLYRPHRFRTCDVSIGQIAMTSSSTDQFLISQICCLKVALRVTLLSLSASNSCAGDCSQLIEMKPETYACCRSSPAYSIGSRMKTSRTPGHGMKSIQLSCGTHIWVGEGLMNAGSAA